MRRNENVPEHYLLTAIVQGIKNISAKLFSMFKAIFLKFLRYSERYLFDFQLNFIRTTLENSLFFTRGFSED